MLIIAVSKFLAFQKDKNLVKRINITLDNDYGGQTIIRFNTSRYNKPIFNTILAVTNTFLLSGGAIYYITYFHIHVHEDSHSEYIQRFWFIWGTKLVIITIIPIVMVAFFLKDFRTFIVKMFSKWKKENFCKYILYHSIADFWFFGIQNRNLKKEFVCLCSRNFNTRSLQMYVYINVHNLKNWNICSVVFKTFSFLYFILATL